MASRITFNGKTYARVEDMPPEARKVYEQVLARLADTDRNGVPDVLDRKPEGASVIDIEHTSIVVNGRTYSSVDEMPPADRRLYETAAARVVWNPGVTTGSLRGPVNPLLVGALMLAALAVVVALWILSL